MGQEQTFDDISDTSRWVAMYRAMETERSDALFRDPFARRLAGPKGETILRELRNGKGSAWAPIVRTCIFDETILQLVREKRVDAVLNLAAGLCTRPYRLELPADLLWVEVDFPGLIAHKERELARDRPRCALERIAADLSDSANRRRVLDELGSRGKRFLVLTEGLLIYLKDDDVLGLARDLETRPSFRSWLVDLTSPEMLKFLQRSWGKKLGEASAPMIFAPEQGAEFFRPAGWVSVQNKSFLIEGRRLKRTMPLFPIWKVASFFMTAKMMERARYLNGTFLLERAPR